MDAPAISAAAPATSAAALARPAGPKALLEVEGVTLQYSTPEHLVTATYRVDFQVLPGDRILLGPSGCGKSTLLKAVGGYMAPVEGEIRLEGQPVTEPGPDRMMVFQEFDQLLPWKTVRQNVMFPLRASGRLPRARRRRARAALHRQGRPRRSSPTAIRTRCRAA